MHDTPDSGTEGPLTCGPERTSVGRFGTADAATWTLSWVSATGEVVATRDQVSPSGVPEPSDVRLLGFLPNVDYLYETISAIDEAHGSRNWEIGHQPQPN